MSLDDKALWNIVVFETDTRLYDARPDNHALRYE
jgi:hypothetical protein